MRFNKCDNQLYHEIIQSQNNVWQFEYVLKNQQCVIIIV